MRASLRTAALGCWRIIDDGLRSTWWLPLYMGLDTTISRHVDARGYRTAWRLDSFGERLLKDVEGFAILDAWAADSLSDQVVIFTSNALYGAILVLKLPTDLPADTMRGLGQEYGDVSPQPAVPIVPVVAIRTECRGSTGEDGF
jgi:hypothetical protein